MVKATAKKRKFFVSRLRCLMQNILLLILSFILFPFCCCFSVSATKEIPAKKTTAVTSPVKKTTIVSSPPLIKKSSDNPALGSLFKPGKATTSPSNDTIETIVTVDDLADDVGMPHQGRDDTVVTDTTNTNGVSFVSNGNNAENNNVVAEVSGKNDHSVADNNGVAKISTNNVDSDDDDLDLNNVKVSSVVSAPKAFLADGLMGSNDSSTEKPPAKKRGDIPHLFMFVSNLIGDIFMHFIIISGSDNPDNLYQTFLGKLMFDFLLNKKSELLFTQLGILPKFCFNAHDANGQVINFPNTSTKFGVERTFPRYVQMFGFRKKVAPMTKNEMWDTLDKFRMEMKQLQWGNNSMRNREIIIPERFCIGTNMHIGKYLGLEQSSDLLRFLEPTFVCKQDWGKKHKDVMKTFWRPGTWTYDQVIYFGAPSYWMSESQARKHLTADQLKKILPKILQLGNST